jgi:hypothetical protein
MRQDCHLEQKHNCDYDRSGHMAGPDFIPRLWQVHPADILDHDFLRNSVIQTDIVDVSSTSSRLSEPPGLT